ncbi:FecCD family ABC transporter permease [Secundilactobacillus kimchicus]|uniref:FecCD family ABC transporter permease n=1 Tax=Secundilactobacillus kimchicus TaxID=528209 RepID=UPI0024A856A1|nr:iron ABC transporter permease [Secundilactobacillus kimchicus]
MTRHWHWFELIGVAGLLVAAMIAVLSVGDISLSPATTIRVLLGQSSDFQANFVIWQLRFPRLLAALITGSTLALAGLLLQTLTQNALADSSILGINAGASLGAVTLMAVAGMIGTHYTSGQLSLAVLVNRQQNAIRILLGGVALTAVMNGFILLIELQLNQFDFSQALIWLSGSFWNTNLTFLTWHFWLAVGLGLATGLTIPLLTGLTLGPGMAEGIGVNVKMAQRVLMALAIGLTTIAVSVGGAISFVGLMAPNIAKRFVGLRMRWLVPLSWIMGMLIMVIAEFIATNVLGKMSLPVGLVVAMITMPYFIFQLFSQRTTLNRGTH